MIKELLTTLFNAPNPRPLPSWANWGITHTQHIETLSDDEEGALGLAGNLCIDADEDSDMDEDYYKTYIAPIQNYLDNHYKPDAQQQLNDRLK